MVCVAILEQPLRGLPRGIKCGIIERIGLRIGQGKHLSKTFFVHQALPVVRLRPDGLPDEQREERRNRCVIVMCLHFFV